jgi:hypothetical protein
VKKKTRPPQIDNLHDKIRECIGNERYMQTKHALDRESERSIELPDALYVLKNGHHEKKKTTFDETFQSWKYAIRGLTLDDLDIRIIIAFDENDMLIITVMQVT